MKQKSITLDQFERLIWDDNDCIVKSPPGHPEVIEYYDEQAYEYGYGVLIAKAVIGKYCNQYYEVYT